jgi:hypothetical protein
MPIRGEQGDGGGGGTGIPAGGTKDQVLAKNSGVDGDAIWKTILATSGLAKLSVGPVAPVGPGIGDLWVDTT